jgi:phosphonate transport system substrate-binding protein
MRWIAATLLLLTLAGCYKPEAESYPLGHEKNPLVMAFVPSTEAEKVISSGEELTQLLTDQSGLHFKPLIATSYVGIVEAMAVERVHIGWLPPLAYVYANQRNADEVILKVVRHGSPTYRGQIVVLKDSGIGSLDDLAGKRLGFPDPASTSGYLYPMKLLIDAGYDPESDFELMALGSHDAAVIALVKGSIDAALCYDDARGKLLETDFADDIDLTKILAYTPDIPADNVAVVDGLGPELREKIRQALTDLAATEDGAEVLYDLYEVEGLVAAADADYDVVREMAQVMGLDIEAKLRSEAE